MKGEDGKEIDRGRKGEGDGKGRRFGGFSSSSIYHLV